MRTDVIFTFVLFFLLCILSFYFDLNWIALDLRAIQQIQASLPFTEVSSGSAIPQQPFLTPIFLLAEAIPTVH